MKKAVTEKQPKTKAKVQEESPIKNASVKEMLVHLTTKSALKFWLI
ncbi:hypothetical protein IJU97_05970 [bacterium]|nr:hypothetical protein [bacterium]